jgi:hypothetical protein
MLGKSPAIDYRAIPQAHSQWRTPYVCNTSEGTHSVDRHKRVVYSYAQARLVISFPYYPPRPLALDLTILGPLVLTTDLLLLFRGEIVGDVECLSDLLG